MHRSFILLQCISHCVLIYEIFIFPQFESHQIDDDFSPQKYVTFPTSEQACFTTFFRPSDSESERLSKTSYAVKSDIDELCVEPRKPLAFSSRVSSASFYFRVNPYSSIISSFVFVVIVMYS